jgi:hypothetical protein
MSSAEDLSAGEAEQGQDRAHYQKQDADRPHDCDLRNETDDQKDDAKNDHHELLTLSFLAGCACGRVATPEAEFKHSQGSDATGVATFGR